MGHQPKQQAVGLRIDGDMLKWLAHKKRGSLWTASLVFTADTAAAPGGPPNPHSPP